MLREIVMPKLGETMEEGTVQQWRVSVGAAIKKGDIIMDVETDKAVIEVEALVEGVLRRIVVENGSTVPIGTVLAYVGDPQDPLPGEAPQPGLAVGAAGGRAADAATGGPEAGASGGVRTGAQAPQREAAVRISPRARRLAEALGIDISQVRGSGPDGRIVSEDIEAIRDRRQAGPAVSPARPEAGRYRLVPHTIMRRKTAERMLQSWTTIPTFDLSLEASADAILELRSRLNASGTRRIAIHDLLIHAVARALEQFEVMTGTWTPEGVSIPEDFGIALAVASPQGLTAPVIRGARGLGLDRIAEASAALVEKARAGRLGPDEMAGACTTISNLGMLGVDHFRPIVIPGQGSILGVGRVRQAIGLEAGTLVPRRVISLTLSVDHRLTDGDYAARFLGAIKSFLERPE